MLYEGFVFVQLRSKYTVHEASVDIEMGPQSTYRGRVAIGECICPLSWSVHYNFVRDGIDKVKGGERATPTLTRVEPAKLSFFKTPYSGEGRPVYTAS
jgi:hypothetical protein